MTENVKDTLIAIGAITGVTLLLLVKLAFALALPALVIWALLQYVGVL